MKRQVIIIGAGAIGSTIGGLLSKKFDVLLVDKNKEHVQAINSQGLILKGKVNETVRVKASTKIDEIKENTVIINATKSFDARNSMKEVKNLLKKDTVVFCLQNGLGAVEEVKKEVNGKVFGGVTYVGAVYEEPGKISVAALGKTLLESSKETKMIAKEFSETELSFEASENYKKVQWEKLTVNCIINPLTALLGVVNEEVADDELKEIRKEIIDECRKVAEKEGVVLDEEFIKEVPARIRSFQSNRSSMLQDIDGGRKTEIDYISGAVVRLGKKHGIETPVNKGLVDLIKFKENTYKKFDELKIKKVKK